MGEDFFINCSNHPSESWGMIQKMEAQKYGKIIDIPFPQIKSTMGKRDIMQVVDQVYQEIIQYHPQAVMCMGEYVTVYHLVSKLKASGIFVLATVSERKVTEMVINGQTIKNSVFEFQGFREY